MCKAQKSAQVTLFCVGQAIKHAQRKCAYAIILERGMKPALDTKENTEEKRGYIYLLESGTTSSLIGASVCWIW